MHWVTALERLHRANVPCAVVTVIRVRGHAPRREGAKMVVALDGVWGSIGGGNVKAMAVRRAREVLASGGTELSTVSARLSDKARAEFGRQCCGGEVDVLIEPIPAVPCVAVFGLGHVGLELARVLSRHDLELHLTDSRAEMLGDDRLACLDGGPARVHVHHEVVPERILARLPAGAQVLVLTHDHAEDFALLDAALRSERIGSIGVIGSSAKWARFRTLLAEAGHEADAVGRVRCPIGIDGIRSKEPAAIAVSVAADVLIRLETHA